MSALARLGVIGVGLIGARHLSLIAAAERCEVVAVADPAPSVAPMVAHYGARFYQNYSDLLSEESLDGVIIATPNALHAEVGIACAAAGLPMLVEKPLTDTLVAGRRLVEAAEAADVPLAVGHHRRFDPAIERARVMIDEGRIGQLVAVHSLWALRKHAAYFEVDWRTRRATGGGPGLINLIHDVDLMRHLCGDVDRVYAELGREARGYEVEDTIAATLRFRSGVLGSVVVSDATPSPWGWEQGSGENPNVPETSLNAMRLLGTRGALALPNLELYRHVEDSPSEWSATIVGEAIPHAPRAALAAQLDHFVSVLRGEVQPRVSGRDGFASLATTLAILSSGERGEAVVPEPCDGEAGTIA